MCVEYLSVEEHSFFWRQRGAYEEIYFVGQFIQPSIMFKQPAVDTVFHMQQALIDTIATQHIVLQNLVCPYAELGTPDGFYPITDRNYHVQGVEFGLVLFPVSGS